MCTDIPGTPPVTPLLDQVRLPSDLKQLDTAQLDQLANELRAFLLYSVGQTGGHFGAGLGVVELTIALHYVLDTPNDDLIWDVGHQAYPHKILTGRRDAMLTMRQQDGLAPFPSRDESPYDSFGVGHSSTSISAALGMALAKQSQNAPSHTVAVIGDGAMTAGMAFEALNHAAHCQAPMLIILNDNTMSISANEGGIASYLENILKKKTKTDNEAPSLHKANLFDDLGLNYSGPVDGHDIKALINKIKKFLNKPGPSLLHIKTTKGQGFAPAVDDPVSYHALTKLEPENKSRAEKTSKPSRKFQDIFGAWICHQAALDPKTVAITPAMREGSGLVEFSKQFPKRFYDVAIAEQHAVTFAAGLACKGLKPVVAIYSTFLQRAYDQVVHDVAIQNLDVTFAIDRAGVVGEDGATHTGGFDINILRCLPNFIIAAPSNEAECELLLSEAYAYPGPAAVRYPRGKASRLSQPTTSPAGIGKAQLIRDGQTLCILNFGALIDQARQVCEQENYGLIDMRWVKPLDQNRLLELTKNYAFFVTLEDGAISGGAGSAVSELFQQLSISTPVLHLGITDVFVKHSTRKQALSKLGLDAQGIHQSIRNWLNT